MFRGKESSNRIKLSRLVQDLLNFDVLGSLRLWGWGGWVDGGGGVDGGCPPHMCTCTHTHAHTHAHACVVNMIIPCKWLPPLDLGKSQGFPMMSYVRAHVCMCVHVHMCGGTLSPPFTPILPSPTPQGGGPPESVKIQ